MCEGAELHPLRRSVNDLSVIINTLVCCELACAGVEARTNHVTHVTSFGNQVLGFKGGTPDCPRAPRDQGLRAIAIRGGHLTCLGSSATT